MNLAFVKSSGSHEDLCYGGCRASYTMGQGCRTRPTWTRQWGSEYKNCMGMIYCMMSVKHWTRNVVRSGPGSHRAKVKGAGIPKGQNVKWALEEKHRCLSGRSFVWREKQGWCFKFGTSLVICAENQDGTRRKLRRGMIYLIPYQTWATSFLTL